MRRNRRRRISILAFIALLLLAGVLHTVDKLFILALLPASSFSVSSGFALASTALFVLNLALYAGLLICWLLSVRLRLLPSRGRAYMTAAALCMIFFLLQRVVKYRIAESDTLFEHICWYLYYLPLTAIPNLFLLTCLSIGKPGPRPTRPEWIICLLAALVILAVLTNDLHYGMFRPLGPVSRGDAWETYENGPLWYLFYGYMGLCILLGLFLLVKADFLHGSGRYAFYTAIYLIIMLGSMFIMDAINAHYNLPIPYMFPEIFIFGMLAIFESCIRNRLIPFNENYAAFFSRMDLAAAILDRSLAPVYTTAKPIPATAAQCRAAIADPLTLDEDTRLYGMKISAGYAFWTSNGRALRLLNEELEEAAEMLKEENDLLYYESEQQAARKRVDARNLVYTRAAAEIYDTQKQISQELDAISPEAADYRKRLAYILFLNAYVKRKTNFVLLTVERDLVSAEELYLALEESIRFLNLCGIDGSVERKATRSFSNKEASALYDSFQRIAMNMIGPTSSLMVVLTDEGIRMMAEGGPFDLPVKLPASPVTRAEDDQLFIFLSVGKRGDE